MTMDAGLDSADPNLGGQDAASNDKAEAGGASAEPPDAGKLAQDWITLWQSELSAMAADPEMRESWQAAMALWAGTISTMLRGMPRTRAPEVYDRKGGSTRTADAPRAAPVAAASDARDAEIERLARHVATLERRLADIERGGDPPIRPKRGSGRKPRK